MGVLQEYRWKERDIFENVESMASESEEEQREWTEVRSKNARKKNSVSRHSESNTQNE